jgi:copper(I)-binding protein
MRLIHLISWGCALASAIGGPAAAEPRPDRALPAPAGLANVLNAATSEAVTAGSLEISGFWAKAMLPGQPTGGGYLTITNKGKEPDRLISVSSAAAGMVEIHTMQIVNDVMNMRPLAGPLEIPAGATVEIDQGGGMHLMFMSVKEPFKAGTTVPLTLEFEKAGKVELMLPVKKSAAD